MTLTEEYGSSTNENFYIKDSIGVPHPYCITPKHVEWAADHHGGMLGKDAIEQAEKHGARCDICKGKLTFAQHEKALLVACKKDFQTDKEAQEELQNYLKGIVTRAKKAGYADFAFVKE